MDMSVVRLPWYAQIGTFLVLGIAATGVFMWYYERPVREGMQSRVAQLTELRGTIGKGLATAKQLPQFRAEVDDLENRLGSLRAVLPDEKDTADLLRRMQTVATQSNLTIKSFSLLRLLRNSFMRSGRSRSSSRARITTSRSFSTASASLRASSTSAASM